MRFSASGVNRSGNLTTACIRCRKDSNAPAPVKAAGVSSKLFAGHKDILSLVQKAAYAQSKCGTNHPA